ncbi:spore maturation protein [Christensenellaceae bacterium NSJ-44]|uniref:Spore maturation protein n=1 Tax=Luoshenia tenuis TaxID=2763654 RepID=A0A926CYY1_9FIRM|nr:nucleoside recognition domain-containing protein [Luoshenia tenuis]MBC8528668.1 spore maturation protein [Luoshenia tenuis]
MQLLQSAGDLVIPVIIALIVLFAALRGVQGYDVFVQGARQGLGTALRVLPFLTAMLVAVAMLRASGALGALENALAAPLAAIGMPKELLGLTLIRPLSGSAALGVISELFTAYGPDSMIGRMASVMMGSTETVFYTVALYFGVVGVQKTRYTIPAALLAMLAGTVAAIGICNLMWGG